jgi:hypothetical protein
MLNLQGQRLKYDKQFAFDFAKTLQEWAESPNFHNRRSLTYGRKYHITTAYKAELLIKILPSSPSGRRPLVQAVV